jgi:hypothetical protein
VAVRTLDALHLAPIDYLPSRRQTTTLASFDERLLAGAHALDIPIYSGQRETRLGKWHGPGARSAISGV